jgi:hypothetical protein
MKLFVALLLTAPFQQSRARALEGTVATVASLLLLDYPVSLQWLLMVLADLSLLVRLIPINKTANFFRQLLS